jgi:hypothetical protein
LAKTLDPEGPYAENCYEVMPSNFESQKMTIPETYINNVGSLTRFMNQIQTAGVPERVTFEFLKTLGFASSNDRPIITVLKAIGFLDQNGAPTELYRLYRDTTQGPRVLGKALKTSYGDLFLANTKANDLPLDKLKGIISAKTAKGETVVKLIASTFKALCGLADFSEPADMPPREIQSHEKILQEPSGVTGNLHPIALQERHGKSPSLHYNIQIHLPTTNDIAVYNAIFKSIKEHLL